MNEIRWEACVGNGVCGVEVDRKDIPMNKLVATTLEHLMHVYDVRTQHPDEGFACKRVNTKASTIWSAKHLPQNRDISAACCGNGDIMLYKYNYPKERSRKDAKGLPQEVAGECTLLNKKISARSQYQASTGTLISVVCVRWARLTRVCALR